ncbi:MAG: PPC domain-containing DNA-binding protein [Candidatus Scatomorpha sp.]|jgi:predicted DNA-binding protein with PD1-like motif
MEYKRFNEKIIVRLDPGDELVSSLLKIAEKENILFANVTGIGASNNLVVGVYDIDDRQYYKRRFDDRNYEIVSLVGNINRMDGESYVHVHATIGSPRSSHCEGGHLNEAYISVTAEIVLDVIKAEVGRKYSEEIGLNIFKF